jgi:hypothetical protein
MFRLYSTRLSPVMSPESSTFSEPKYAASIERRKKPPTGTPAGALVRA